MWLWKIIERKDIGLITAICMVVGIVIGSGVFFKAQNVLSLTNKNMPLGILAWLIGGGIATFIIGVINGYLRPLACSAK